MRLFILILASLNALLLIAGFIVSVIGSMTTDPAGKGIVQAYAIAMLLVFLIFVLPSLLLAYKDRLLGLALTLTIIATLIVIFFIYVW